MSRNVAQRLVRGVCSGCAQNEVFQGVPDLIDFTEACRIERGDRRFLVRRDDDEPFTRKALQGVRDRDATDAEFDRELRADKFGAGHQSAARDRLPQALIGLFFECAVAVKWREPQIAHRSLQPHAL